MPGTFLPKSLKDIFLSGRFRRPVPTRFSYVFLGFCCRFLFHADFSSLAAPIGRTLFFVVCLFLTEKPSCSVAGNSF